MTRKKKEIEKKVEPARLVLVPEDAKKREDAEVKKIAFYLAAIMLGAVILAGVAILFIAALTWLGVL